MANPKQFPPQQALQAGVAAYKAGQLDIAWRHLSSLRHAQAQNIAAVCAQRLGRTDDAAAAYARASALAPSDPDIANNRGHFELALGNIDTAEQLFESALKVAPTQTPALIGRAKVAAARLQWAEAAETWQAVVEANSKSEEGRYGLGTAQLEMGDAEAAAATFSDMQAETDRPEVAFMLGRALLDLGDASAAEVQLRRSHDRAPTVHSLRALANFYWMRSDTSKFRSLIEAAPQSLASTAVKLVLETEDTVHARAVWHRAFDQVDPGAEGWTLAAQIARIEGDGGGAAQAADRALAADPHHSSAMDTRIVADLMLGDATAALARITPMKAREPASQNWIAHESVAYRLLGRDEGTALNDAENLVRAYELDLPDGYASLANFNETLAQTLRQMHVYSARPLDQSLRGRGTQTPRSLLESDDPVIRAYIAALDGPIRRYLADIGSAAGHPTTSRNQGAYRFRGMWSVRLMGQGFHEAHVHPEGWISSAYYVSVPNGTAESSDRAGWIGFGRPPYPTKPNLDALKWIAPKAGQLVLFPSYMWHGTEPIADDAERITAPFDLLPG